MPTAHRSSPPSARSGMRARSCFAIALLLGSTLLVGCSDDDSSRRPRPAWDVDDPGLPARLQEALARWADDHGVVGAGGAVLTPGWLEWSGSTGVDDRETGEPFTADRVGRVGSSTKPFTSSLALQLVDEGLIALDTPLSDYLPDYPNADRITLELLLRHRSGLNELQLVDGFFVLTIIADPDRWYEPEDILEWTTRRLPMLNLGSFELEPRGPVGEPGERYFYSQPGYIAAGLMLERATGRDLADLYEERIVRRLGLESTYLPRPGGPFDPVGYTNVFGLLPEAVASDTIVSSPDGLISASWSAGGLVASAPDLAHFLAGMLEGRLFSDAGLAVATDWLPTVSGVGPEDSDYGLGLFRSQEDGIDQIGHNGGLPSGGAVMVYLPEFDVYVAAVVNNDRDFGNSAPDLPERVRRALFDEAQ